MIQLLCDIIQQYFNIDDGGATYRGPIVSYISCPAVNERGGGKEPYLGRLV